MVAVVVVPAGTLKESGVEDEGEDSVARARAQEVKMREAWRQRVRLGRQDGRDMAGGRVNCVPREGGERRRGGRFGDVVLMVL